MKKFVLKIVLFALGAVVILQLPSFFLPSYWGNEIYEAKFDFLNKTDEKFDTYFIGTSRVANGINPAFFDKKNKKGTKSFNLGAPGSNGFENIKIIEELIDKEKYNTKKIFVEAPLFIVHQGKNRNTVRGRYFFDWNNLLYVVKSTLNTNFPLKRKIIVTMDHIDLYLNNLFQVGLFREQLKRFIWESDNNRFDRIKKNKGFYPLQNGTQHKADKARREKFLKDKSILVKRKKGARRVFGEKSDKLEIHNMYVQNLKKLLKRASEKNIEIFFILLPKAAESYYKMCYPSLDNQFEDNYINLANPSEYPDFYKFDYSFDRAHLNKRGANELTKTLVEKVNEMRQ